MILFILPIQLFFFMWLSLAIAGRLLLCFRDDYHRIYEDMKKIRSSGIFKWSTYTFIALLLLPFSIPYSIGNIKNKKK